MTEQGGQQDLLIVSSSPHVKTRETTRRLMGDVLIALLPAVAAGAWYFGLRALAVIAVSVATAVLAEHAVAVLGRNRSPVGDLSAAVTGLLLALNLPPTVPLFMPVIGSAFAVLIVKTLFGGLGANFLNPALAARGLLLAAWPVRMTAWVRPLDLVSTATPLAALVPKGVAGVPLATYMDLFLGRIPGCIGETCKLALLAGGIYLLWRKVIEWHTPVAFIGTVFALTWLWGPRGMGTGDPLAHVLTGGLFLGAFFMATDYVTSPVTRAGRLAMGIGCGLFTVLIRLFGGYPEGVSYSIMVLNVLTPLIDRWISPRRFGAVKRS
jgi:electron transport complex protein RnfD